jgi:glycine betaine/proline transport system ATP-binding protein
MPHPDASDPDATPDGVDVVAQLAMYGEWLGERLESVSAEDLFPGHSNEKTNAETPCPASWNSSIPDFDNVTTPSADSARRVTSATVSRTQGSGEGSPMTEADDVIIQLDRVFKIFGPQPRGRALTLAKSGMKKNEVQKATDHVVGMSDVSFDVKRGETFVIMGLSGSGKSTAIRTVNKLHDITDGHVYVDGVDVQALEGQALQQFRREKMGMVFQHFALFPHRSVIDNTGYGLKVQGVEREQRNAQSLEALRLVGLDAFAHSSPRQLSGGMQQRVGLARALAADPDILLMDEAFSALDPLIRRQMQDEMLAIQDQLHKTILFITHDLNEALRIGDRVCIMKDGAVVQIGTPEEILTQPATGYVAEFVQDVDQGRVIDVRTIMNEPVIVDSSMTVQAALDKMNGALAAFSVDGDGRPTGLLAFDDAHKALAAGNNDLGSVLRNDFDTASPRATFNEIYAEAGRGLGIAVVDDGGKLVGATHLRDMMEEMGRVERLIDGFEREVFM